MRNGTPIRNEPVRKRRGRWIAYGIVLLSAAIAAHLAVKRLTDPMRLRAIAEAYLQQFVPGRASVTSASFSWLDGIHLFDVRVYDEQGTGDSPVDSAGSGLLFSAHEIKLTPDLVSAITGNLAIRSVVAFLPTCNIVRDAATGHTNLAGLLSKLALLDTSARLGAWPSIELQGARIRVFNRNSGGDRLVEDMTLTVRGNLSHKDSRYYDVVWQSGGPRVASGHTQIDLPTGRILNVSGGLPWMSIEAVMIAVNAQYDVAGTWSDLLGLDGDVRATDFHFGGPGEDDPRFATVELRKAHISIPISEADRSAPFDERYLRFDLVDGFAKLTAAGIRAEFDGLFHGSECHVSATLRAAVQKPTTLDDVDFDVRVSIKHLILPGTAPDARAGENRFIARWPRLARFFRDYDPHGAVDLDLEAAKQAGEQTPVIAYRVLLRSINTNASWSVFPYRLTGLTGTVEITPEAVELRNLKGFHNGGTVIVDGRLDHPDRGWPGHVTVTGTAVPIDDALRTALPARFRGIPTSLRPEGEIDVDLSLTRATSKTEDRAPWELETTIRFDDLAVCYVGFPYPLQGLAGAVTIKKGRIDLIDLVARAGDAHVGISGVARLPRNRPTELDLQISATGVAIDDLLLSSLPEETRDAMAQLAPAGRFDLNTVLTRDPLTGSFHHSSKIVLNDASFHHALFPGRLVHVHGNMTIDPTSLRIADLVGSLGGDTVTIRGSLDHSGARGAVDLEIGCRGLGVAASLRDVLPAEMGASLANATVEGPVRAELRLRRSGDAPLAIEGMTQLDGVLVRHPRLPAPLAQVTGRITFDGAGVHATGIEATYQDAHLQLDIETQRSASANEGLIKITVNGLKLDDAVRDILPDRLRASWNRLEPSGVVDLRIDRLRYRSSGPDALREWSIDGRANLYDVSLRGVGNMQGITGTVAGRGLLVDERDGTTLDGTMELVKVEFEGQPIERLSSQWSYVRRADGRGLLSLGSMRGTLYEGDGTAKLEIALGPQPAQYDASILVKNLNIASSLASKTQSEYAPSTNPDPVRGSADVRLYLSGRVGDPSSKRGGGRVEIVDGQMYRLPIMLAILNVINLAVPDEKAFQNAGADFHIVGNRIELTNIVLRGDLLALAGSGSMTWPDQGLNLHLVNVSPYRWPRLPGLEDFVEGATRTFLELHVTGPLAQPTVTARPLPSISDELKRLFRKKDPKRTVSNAP